MKPGTATTLCQRLSQGQYQQHPSLKPGSHRHQRQLGAVALLFLLTLVITLGSLLAALDYGRLQMAQARLQQSLDASVDAAIRQLGASPQHDKDDWEDILQPWMAKGYPKGFANSELIGAQPAIELDSTGLIAQAHGKLRLLSAGLLDLTTASFSAQRFVPFSENKLDVVIAIDTTQLRSNAGNDPVRQTALQLAAETLRHSGNRVAIVPFSDTVNVGTDDPHGWLDERWKDQVWFEDVWRGCVTEIGMGSLKPDGSWTAEPVIPQAPPMGWGQTRRLAPLMIRSEHAVLISAQSQDNSVYLQFTSADKGPTPNMMLSNMRLADELTAVSNTILKYGLQEQDNGSVRLDYTLVGASNNCLAENTIAPFNSDYSRLENQILKLQPETNTDNGLLPLGLLWSWRTMQTLPASAEPRERAVVVIASGENTPTPAGQTVEAEKSENLTIGFLVDSIFCPGLAGGHTDKCNPGHQHTKENREGQITITSRATDTRRSVTSLNTDGPELTTSLEQTRAEDLEIYTLHWCEQLNQLASPNDLPVYWMAPQETPSHLISLCTDNEADRFEPFTAANYPSAVRNLVDRMMAREYR